MSSPLTDSELLLLGSMTGNMAGKWSKCPMNENTSARNWPFLMALGMLAGTLAAVDCLFLLGAFILTDWGLMVAAAWLVSLNFNNNKQYDWPSLDGLETLFWVSAAAWPVSLNFSNDKQYDWLSLDGLETLFWVSVSQESTWLCFDDDWACDMSLGT